MRTPLITLGRLAVVLLAPCLLATALSGSGAEATGTETPMTDEDVVRLHVSGVEPRLIIERIRSSAVAFDLSDEMLDELRAAALPEVVVRAMLERQREWDAEHSVPEESEQSEESGSPSVPRLQVRLNPDGKRGDGEERPHLRFLDSIDPAVYERLRLRGSQPRFTDIALVLACRTPDHVPDQWRSKTPLGRDFVNTPRHRLLAFVPGATRKDAGKVREFASRLARAPGEREKLPELGLLELELPVAIEAELEPGVIHDLFLGVALQAEERYYMIAADDWEGFVLPEEGTSIEATISGPAKDPMSVEVRFRRTAPTAE